jgi:hypothetical protein
MYQRDLNEHALDWVSRMEDPRPQWLRLQARSVRLRRCRWRSQVLPDDSRGQRAPPTNAEGRHRDGYSARTTPTAGRRFGDSARHTTTEKSPRRSCRLTSLIANISMPPSYESQNPNSSFLAGVPEGRWSGAPTPTPPLASPPRPLAGSFSWPEACESQPSGPCCPVSRPGSHRGRGDRSADPNPQPPAALDQSLCLPR